MFDVRISQDTGCGHAGQNEGGRLVGGEVRVREESVGSFIDFTDAVHFAGDEA